MDTPQYISFVFPGLESVVCIFGTRLGGGSSGDFSQGNISLEVGDVRDRAMANRAHLQRELVFSRWVELEQVHGDQVHFDPAGDFEQGPRLQGDGIGISEPGAAAVIKTADCQPVFLVHASGRYVCALHCGWRGNRAGFPETGVREFCRHYGLSPAEIMAVRGPSLGPCCARFESFHEHWGSDFYDYYQTDLQTMDLWALTRDQLARGGLARENIFSLDLCTKCLEDLFFSYRREKRSGRQANLVFIRHGSRNGM